MRRTGQDTSRQLEPIFAEIKESYRYEAGVQIISYSQDGCWRAVVLKDSNEISLEALANKTVLKLQGHKRSIQCVIFGKHGQVITGSADGVVTIWDETGHVVSSWQAHANAVNCMVLDARGWLITGSYDHTLKGWDEMGQCRYIAVGHEGWINCAARLPQGPVISASDDGTIKIWDSTGQCKTTLAGHRPFGVCCVAVTKRGEIVSGGLDKMVKLWDAQGRCCHTFVGHEDSVISIAVTATDWIISADESGMILIWDQHGVKRRMFPVFTQGEINCLTLDAEDNVVFGSKEGMLVRWQPLSAWLPHRLALNENDNNNVENQSAPFAIALTQVSSLPPAYWRLPFFVQDIFINRPELTEQVALKLAQSRQKGLGTVALTTLLGLGGVGKTQLALHYAYQTAKQYSLRVWFRAEHLLADYQAFALERKLIPPACSEQEVIQAVTQWLETHPGWLVIYDNAETLEKLQSYLPRSSGDVLITSRHQAWPNCVEVDVMTHTQALQLAETVIGTADTKLGELVERLGHLPLAIAQAAAYIQRHHKTVADYLRLYETQAERLLTYIDPLSVHHHDPVAVTWQVNLQGLISDSPDAIKLLSVLAFLAPDAIPCTLLQQILFHKVDEATEIALDTLLGPLYDYSLVKQTTGNHYVSIHRLLQTVIRQQLARQQQTEHYILMTMRGLKEAEYWATSLQDAFAKELTLLPHLEQIIQAAKQQFSLFSIPDSSLLFACLLQQWGVIQYELGNIHLAKQKYKEALEIQEQHYGPNNDEVASTLANLGNACGALGEIEEQKALLERALRIQEQHYGSDHYEVAITLANLGNAYGIQGQVEEQKTLLERALCIQEQYYGPNHYEVAFTLANLSNLYGTQGQVKEQKALLKRALRILEQHYTSDHYEVAITLANLGYAYGALGQVKKQKALLERALRIQEQHYGPNHWQLVITLYNLAQAFYSLQQFQEAQTLLLHARTILRAYPKMTEGGILKKASDAIECNLKAWEKFPSNQHYQQALLATQARQSWAQSRSNSASSDPSQDAANVNNNEIPGTAFKRPTN